MNFENWNVIIVLLFVFNDTNRLNGKGVEMLSNSKEHPLDQFQNVFHRYIRRFDCILFFIIFAIAMLVHLYMFTHKFINHDDVGALYTNGSYAIFSARWFIAPLTRLTGNISSPWLNGLVSTLFLSLAAVLIVRIFQIKHYAPAILMGVSLVAFPVVASTYTYMFSAVPYMFALLFAVVGAYLIRSEKLPFMALGSIAIALAMGCYQAYFCLAVVILLTVVGLDLLDDRFDGSFKRIFFTGVKYVLFLAAGMVLYFIILKICLHVKNIALVSYQGIDTMGQIGFSQLIRRIADAYSDFVKFFTNSSKVFHSWFVQLVGAAVLLTVIAIAIEIKNKKLWRKPVTLIFLAVIIVLFPLASSLVYVMVDSAVSAVHLVMLYPMVMLLVLPAVALDRLQLPVSNAAAWKKQLCVFFALALLVVQALIGYECVLITNRAYFSMGITYENTYAFYTKLTAKLELQEEYTPETPVAFIGRAKMQEYAPSTNMTGVLNGNSAINMYTVPQYLRYLLASNYTFVSDQREAELSATTEFQEMPSYPAAGSIRTIDGVIVVKFSG